MNMIDRIRAGFDAMTRTERQVASYFPGHEGEFTFCTLDKLSGRIGTSTASVIRFCRRLGFDGYKEFQQTLRADLGAQPDLPDKFRRTADSAPRNALWQAAVQQDIRCLQQTAQLLSDEKLSEAVRRISEAKRVYTFGMKESFALAHYLYTRLLTVRPDVYLLAAGYNGTVEPLLSLTPQDVCIVFLFHRYTQQTLQLLPMLQKQGVQVILVTSEPFDAVESYAALLLECRVDAGGIKNTAAAPVCLADYLCNAVAMQGGEKTLAYMRRTEQLFETGCVLGD